MSTAQSLGKEIAKKANEKNPCWKCNLKEEKLTSFGPCEYYLLCNRYRTWDIDIATPAIDKILRIHGFVPDD